MKKLKEYKETIRCQCDRNITYYDFDTDINISIDQKLYNAFINHKCINIADGYVYTLKLKNLHNEEIYYYVGMSFSTKRDPLKTLSNRISEHVVNNGDCALEYEDDGLKYLIKNTFNKKDKEFINHKIIAIENIKSLNKFSRENRELFKYRCKNEERKMFIQVANEKDTINLLGGH